MSCTKIFSLLSNKPNTFRGIVTAYRFKSDEPAWVPKDPKTHTGQSWESDDFRLARFINTPKQINTNFAIDLIAKVPPKPCKDRIVYCDGGDEHTGHPRVYINLDKPGNHTCGYCGLRFYLEHH